jgi:membrane-bound lytic murein transglycosylase B
MRPPILLLCAALVALGCPSAGASRNKLQRPSDTPSYAARDDAMAFADGVAARHGLDAAAVRAAIGEARYQPRVAQLIMPPPAGTARDWAAYRDRFIEPTRLRAGVDFWRANADWLRRAEERYGVPPEIVVGIVGVETIYGRHLGNFRVVDALATLAFDFPTGRRDRSGFFRDELEALFVLGQRSGADPLALRGSYAGAIGMPQFMPSSMIRYAVDFDDDGRVDLHTNPADVIGSVARYLHDFGWQRGMPTHFDVAAPIDDGDRALLLAPDIVPSFTAEQLAERGAVLSAAGQAHGGLLALVELQNGNAAPSYVAGTQNFHVVTRYNWSSYYALAVIELGANVATLVKALR